MPLQTQCHSAINDYPRIVVCRHSQPWWGRLFEPDGVNAERDPPQFSRILCYTFGAPRIGNTALANLYNAQQIESYRIVNGNDIVARLPRYQPCFA